MDINEIIAILFGGFVGYWVVSKLFSGKNDKNAPPTPKPDDRPDHSPDDASGSDESAEKWRK